ncbi:MAG: hypothetical protein Q8M98_10470 [Candidatus Cloacimonadaceae bacterium]|nr:hypothetical protein [Candidatus Cloacimonadaceae bacterium]
MPPLTVPTYPSGTTASDLLYSALIDTYIADDIFYGLGSYTAAEVGTKYATKTSMATELNTFLKQLGELAEKPGKTDSKITKLKTRNYLLPGKRTNTVEFVISGISAKQKDYFEGALFSGTEITIVAVNKERERATIFNGMRWVIEWSGEADGLWSVVISTEYSGSSSGRVYLIKGLV